MTGAGPSAKRDVLSIGYVLPSIVTVVRPYVQAGGGQSGGGESEAGGDNGFGHADTPHLHKLAGRCTHRLGSREVWLEEWRGWLGCPILQ